MSTVQGTLTITDARERAAAALAPRGRMPDAGPDDPDVLMNLVDSLEPPVLMLGWDDPWLAASGNCRFVARLAVWCIAARLEPGPGVEVLERLVSYTVERLKADFYSWGNPEVSAPRVMPVGNLEYISARVVYTVPVTINEGG